MQQEIIFSAAEKEISRSMEFNFVLREISAIAAQNICHCCVKLLSMLHAILLRTYEIHRRGKKSSPFTSAS